MIASTLNAEEHSFVLLNGNSGKTINSSGLIEEQISPCSTFKIALSLIGYDMDILINEDAPEWPFLDYDVYLESWRGAQTPKTWMANSVIWFSRVLTAKIGLLKLKDYLMLFNYGNQDVTGDPEQNNALTHAWLNSSLKISPLEQVHFLKKIVKNELPVSQHALHMTKNLLLTEVLEQDWKLFGKTGSGFATNADGSINRKKTLAWYVGWVEKDEQMFSFSLILIQDGPVPSKAERIGCVKNKLKEANILL